jgi:hypothetical protein
VVKGESQSYNKDCLKLRVATVAESNFLVARKNVGENQASTLASGSREPEILRGEYIPISGKVKSFLQNSGCRYNKLSTLETHDQPRLFFELPAQIVCR